MPRLTGSRPCEVVSNDVGRLPNRKTGCHFCWEAPGMTIRACLPSLPDGPLRRITCLASDRLALLFSDGRHAPGCEGSCQDVREAGHRAQRQ